MTSTLSPVCKQGVMWREPSRAGPTTGSRHSVTTASREVQASTSNLERRLVEIGFPDVNELTYLVISDLTPFGFRTPSRKLTKPSKNKKVRTIKPMLCLLHQMKEILYRLCELLNFCCLKVRIHLCNGKMSNIHQAQFCQTAPLDEDFLISVSIHTKLIGRKIENLLFYLWGIFVIVIHLKC